MPSAGRPFWTGFTAFAANMVAMYAINAVDITIFMLLFSLPAALLLSLFVGAAAYGKAKRDEFLDPFS